MSEEYTGEDEFSPLTCQLWFEGIPEHDNPLLLTLFDKTFPHLSSDGKEVVITHESLIYITPEGDPGWGSTVLTQVPLPAMPSLAQSWLWDDAEKALRNCRGVLQLQERLLAWVDPTRRVTAFRSVVAAVCEAMGPAAVVWPKTGVATSPDSTDGLLGFVGIRRLPSPESHDGWIVDTIGMEALNIPDLEVHFRNLDMGGVVAMVTEHADAFIAGTEFIADGDPLVIEGLVPEDPDKELWFTARYLGATTDPLSRRIVGLIPPAPYGIGEVPEMPSAEE